MAALEDELRARDTSAAQRVARAGASPARPGDPANAVELRAVTKSYDVSKAGLQAATFAVRRGEFVFLVGPTGSGKSTLANLTLRLVDPHRGAVTIDEVDVREVTRGGVPSVGVLVPQQTFMFDDTVRGNVTLGGDFTDEQVWEALEVAQATGFVRDLEHGLDTRVGERGTSLSGGQRQRVALARAVVRRPRLLVLDDATSAVDPAVEQQILAALRETASGTTVLVVAYRMSTIVLADDVVYLERGRVVDHGTHAELLGRCAGYQRLVTAYAREAAERAAVAADEEVAR
jgi:ABC-type multidrug transport system fused ATPase/permease subunit